MYYVGHKEERARKFATEVASLQFNVLCTTYEYIMRDRAKLAKVCASPSICLKGDCHVMREVPPSSPGVCDCHLLPSQAGCLRVVAPVIKALSMAMHLLHLWPVCTACMQSADRPTLCDSKVAEHT